MQLFQLILPSLATIALGSALLMPSREERRRTDGDARESAVLGDQRAQAAHGAAPEALSRDADPAMRAGADDPSSIFEGLVRQDAAAAPSATGRNGDSGSLPFGGDSPATIVPQQPEVERGGPVECDPERVVPLTRRRLRRQPRQITWPAGVDSSKTAWSAAERSRLVESIDALASSGAADAILLEALAEEDGDLRLNVVRALSRRGSDAAREAFGDLLVRGTNEERAAAIDALCAIGRREDLVPAFTDRVDAIAAKAVLAYVGSRRRADYFEVFENQLDRSQRDRISALLAGALE